MLATTIRAPPSVEDYVPLAEYQSQTPESFADGKPVLHFHLQGATASVPKSQCGRLALFPADMVPAADEDAQANGQADEEQPVKQKVDVFVNSESFTVFSQQAEAGVSIPYPSISIHAVKHVAGEAEGSRIQAVWMQLEFSDGGANDDDFSTVELTIVPSSPEGNAMRTAAQQLYDAVSNCSDLHPDPDDADDDDGEYDGIVFEGGAEHEALEGFAGVLRGSSNGGLPPPMPGSGGWITADNVHEFFDGDGNWLGRDGEAQDGADGELGEGAGRTRPRDELEPDGANGYDGANEDQDMKRPRVDE
ncbi:regulator of volume decrease after cellular swelling domain-containing protein [Hirsutella rhossiliensis]|uniref:Regulator of volume decrease after cellular swelling domain-containing protein n=1 Tax=Hirsutella rhossiliensis TaxID=111463 RepID=A0A9P8SNM7_9HYPO|nr:regulator of volume decrease after cellular swelling domain-containing protein [Hirsutella rhossiliensis]KAH0968045.1 regulator of volume decrease after cellular swelling domain-containing protein [Hirsutella rhossiliensis]